MFYFAMFYVYAVDIQTVRWLTELLQGMDCILVLVSHDRMFLDAVCTDTVEFKGQALTYFPGSYGEFMANKEEMAARNNNMVDAQARKEGECAAMRGGPPVNFLNILSAQTTSRRASRWLRRAATTP